MMGRELRGLLITGAVALSVSACGSSHSATTTGAATSTAAAASSTTSAAPVTPPRAPRLRIVSPHPGARVAPTLTIRVSLSAAAVTGPHAFRYVLDGSLTRVGSRRLTFRGLAPGAHHLLVALAKRPSIKAHVNFTVPAPATPAPAATTISSAPPTTTAAPTPPPAPATTQATAPAPSPAPSGGIPQGAGAGDDDSDNHGGPSDGDGNI